MNSCSNYSELNKLYYLNLRHHDLDYSENKVAKPTNNTFIPMQLH